MTTEQTLQGIREIRFVGEAIDEVGDSLDMTDWDERYLTLRLFSNDQGGFVAAIEFSSSNSAIASAFEAEHLDTLEEVEKFFLAFDPLDHVSVSQRKDVSSPSILVLRQLSESYSKLVDELLANAAEYCDTHPNSRQVAATSGKEVNRVLKFFGLA